ncbi:mucoidy inhibitor MuiA family protein [Candidatus Thorarchaeota archaeon]|nr:MAG: mucoidy inhibitor MuiA family protein [Candidatus Thorarchaeota archaeon]
MIECDTKIDRVVVFRDGAKVTRVGKIDVKPGQHIVRMGDISRYAETDSFRAKGKGHAKLKNVDTKRVTKTFGPENEIGNLRNELDILEEGKKGIVDRISTQQERVKYLTSILEHFSSEFGKWYPLKDTPLEILDKSHIFITEALGEAKKKIRDLGYELEDVEAKIRTVNANINRVGAARKTETKTIVRIALEAIKETTVDLEISYLHKFARWEPAYDIDLTDERAAVKRIANVVNHSLEDWIDVDLTVSTASMRPVEAIRPQPYYVDAASRAYEPRPSRADKAGFGIAREISPMEVSVSTDRLKPAYAEASQTLGGIVQYDIPGRVTVLSDADPSPVTLTREDLSSRLMYFWNAYAMAEPVAQNEVTIGDSMLLPGKARIYADGDFIGETAMDIVAPDEKIGIGTRVSYDVKCEKLLKTKETEKAGLTRGKTRREYKYELKIQSYAKKDVPIRVVDRIPHSSSEKVNVELKQAEPHPEKQEMGVLEWNLEAHPNEETILSYSFEVEWEKGLKLRPPLP